MECRIGCAACCVVISISSPLPEFPGGKPAGEPCPGLTAEGRCSIWGTPDYPDVCRKFRATEEYCGASSEQAHLRLAALEAATTEG
jgi:Fe-S-cluster containining protein